MSVVDKEKWELKYRDKPQLLEYREASAIVQRYGCRGQGERALDLACGTGRHTLYLASEGFEVDAIDIASAAMEVLMVDALRQGVAERISPIEADLDAYKFENGSYDLIVMSNYLERTLIERTKDALKRGGIYIVETYMQDDENEKRDSKSSNLLQPGELKEIFAQGYKVLHYDEYDNEAHEIYRMRKQVIVAERL